MSENEDFQITMYNTLCGEDPNQLSGINLGGIFVVSIRHISQWAHNVKMTSYQRDHVASTLIRRHFDVMCLLGY